MTHLPFAPCPSSTRVHTGAWALEALPFLSLSLYLYLFLSHRRFELFNKSLVQNSKQQIENLRKQETRRLMKAKKSAHIIERQELQIAQNIQHAEFKKAWENYLEDYDKMAQMYIQQMTERHAVNLNLFQEQMHKKMVEQPSKVGVAVGS